MQTETEYNENYAKYQSQKGWLRWYLRTPYLNNVLKHVTGKTIDLGCGTGRLLSLLPAGSLGLDINPRSIEHCRKIGLDAQVYDAEDDHFALSIFKPGVFKTLTMIHVLEHLTNPVDVLNKLTATCNRLLIDRIIIKIPGKKGFQFDKTHKTFIDTDFIESNNLTCLNNFKLTESSYFPFNIKVLGNYFTHHELTLVYNRGN
ncbi:MAG: class I SAM-dependent methyltransferase [Candidatus Riflebacteria bacterium]|nr:class I SAM-dependent methyltransferase [Candidatus Riflebacteria bacterium]